MSTLYILQLEHGKYYVGKTDDVSKRYSEHKTGRGSEWTRIFKPIKIIETRRILDDHTENNVTKDYMKKYGIENVRGGSYSQVTLSDSSYDSLKREFRGNSDKCFKCGSSDHWAKDCNESEEEEEIVWITNCCGKEFKREFLAIQHERRCRKILETAKNRCYRCGRNGHYSDNCYANYHIKGYELYD